MILTMRKSVKRIGVPRLIISSLLIVILVSGFALRLPIGSMLTDIIKRFGMYGILVLAMVPSIQSGTGPNFALPIGIICGLLGLVISVELGYEHLGGFMAAVFIALPLALAMGFLHGKLLNAVKGSEMTIGPYLGFSIVQVMCIGWILLPFHSPKMLWAIGKGLRVTFTLENNFAQILNNFMDFKIPVNSVGVAEDFIHIPTGLILVFLLTCFIIYLFTKSKSGTMILAAGSNPKFASASGVDINRGRLVANIVSTLLGAFGIIVYSQSYGFVQLYTGPLMMAFPAVAAVLIGGATAKKAKISHAIIGVLLFQGLLASAMPVANKVFPQGNLSDIIRMIVQNGIILYALTKVNGGE